MSTNGKPHRPKPALDTLFSFIFLTVLLFAALIYDHSLIDQIRGFLKEGRWPNFAASTRLVAYFITTFVAAKLAHKHKYPGWLICTASVLVFILAAL
jgi:hypothetical protein